MHGTKFNDYEKGGGDNFALKIGHKVNKAHFYYVDTSGHYMH